MSTYTLEIPVDLLGLALDDLQALERRLGTESRRVREAVHQAKLALALNEYGVTAGSIVECKGKQYRIIKVDVSWQHGKPWAVGNPLRKDGTWGTAQRNLFSDWTLVATTESDA